MLDASSNYQNLGTQWHGLPDGNSYCSVIPINQGSLVLQESEWVSKGTDAKTRKPAFVFLITHHLSGEKILWDLGIRKEFLDDYPHPSCSHFQTHFEKDVSQILQEIGIASTGINRVIISHKHWDHTGNSHPYSRAEFYVGAGDEDAKAFKGSVTDRLNIINWKTDPGSPVASFDHSRDLYGDGSVIIVDAHGHTAGHLNLLVRTGKNEWILLASDGCHYPSLLSSAAGKANLTFGRYREHWEYEGTPPTHSYYDDVGQSEIHLKRMRACEMSSDIMVVIAHDEIRWRDWFETGYGVGPDLRDWKAKGYKSLSE